MSNAEQFVREHTRNCSNEHIEVKCKSKEKVIFSYEPWLTPDQALRAVEIEREELIDKVCDFLKDHLDGYDIPKNDIERSIETFKLAMED